MAQRIDSLAGLIYQQAVLSDIPENDLDGFLNRDRFALGYVFGLLDAGSVLFNGMQDKNYAVAFILAVIERLVGSEERAVVLLQSALALQPDDLFAKGRALGVEEIGDWFRTEGKRVPMGLARHSESPSA